MEPRDFFRMVNSIRLIKKSLGVSEKFINDAEIENCSIAKDQFMQKKILKREKL